MDRLSITQMFDSMTRGKRLIETENMGLQDWLDLLRRKPSEALYVDYQFPADKHRDEYLRTIQERSEEDVLWLLRHFLWLPGTFPTDRINAEDLLVKWKKEGLPKRFRELERRLVMWVSSKGRVPVWDGTQWVLDLLLVQPSEALRALNAYMSVYAACLPDGRFFGLCDAMEVIRARYFETPASGEEFTGTTPDDLEYLVSLLYDRMGFAARITRPRKDGGVDVVACCKEQGRRERILIEVKHHARPVGVELARNLLGVVTSQKANRGVLVTTSTFTAGARQLEKDNPRLELIDGASLVRLLNEHAGSNWATKVDRLIAEERRRLGDSIR